MDKKEIIKEILVYLGIIFTFLILDVGLRYLVREKIGFVSVKSFSPLAFSLSYVIILLLLCLIFNKKSKVIYVVLTILANIYFVAQIVHFQILGNVFSLVSLFSVGEANDYLSYAITYINAKVLIVVLLSLVAMITVLVLTKGKDLLDTTCKKKKLIAILIIFVLFRVSAIYKLGKPKSETAWDAWKVPRNVYNNYGNKNRSMMTSGLYEYIFRDIYLYTKNHFFRNDKKLIAEIDDYLNNLNITIEKNEYTGVFKDKNLIVIMLESIDNWLVTEETMPTLYNLSNEGLNFTNRYAPFFGSGMTINSEFASITGLYAVTNDKAIYNYSYNNYDYSLPSLFKKNSYVVNSMHMNSGAFYNRHDFHVGLGFDEHYPLYDMGFNDHFDHDTVIAKNDNSYKLIVNDNKFFTFITTYSAHVPYSNNPMCEELMPKDSDHSEMTCLKTLAKETDDFIKLLMERLYDDGYLDNTVFVFFADHYSYGYSDIYNLKGTEDSNLIQKTPLIIWSNDIEHKDIDTITDTADIPTTLFNMFGITYNPKLYMGTDIFSKEHEKFVYFNDYSWYDGKNYSKEVADSEYVKKISEKVNQKININQKIIASDFYKTYRDDN